MHRIGWAFLATFTCVAVLSPKVAGQHHRAPLTFSTCSQPCGNGNMTADSCDEKKCWKVTEGCYNRPCDERKYRLSVTPWSACSKECGGGNKTRSVGEDSESRPCNMHPCRLDNGQFPYGDCPADVLIVIDRSGSMGWDGKWTDVIDFAEWIVLGLPVTNSVGKTRVGVITFNSEANLVIPIGAYSSQSDLITKIGDIGLAGASGATNIIEAVDLTYSTFLADPRFGMPGYRFAAIFITDGAHNFPYVPDALYAIQQAILPMLVVGNNIATMSIGIGYNTDNPTYVEQVKALSSLEDYFYLRPDSIEILDLITDMLTFMCEDDCFRCDYSQGQMWLQYKPNCHQFIVCEPNGKGGYTKHLMTCGSLFWNQAKHTCTGVMTGFCFEGPDLSYTGMPNVWGSCPYAPLANPRYFSSIDDPSKIQHCKPGFQFANPPCTCIVVGPITPTCADDLLLHFDFEKDFVDVTCHNAVADQYGTGSVTRVSDSYRSGLVASFDGVTHLEVPFLRTWFAEHYVDGFSVSLYYKRGGGSDAVFGALVTNGDCKDKPGFSMRARAGNQLLSQIRTDSGGVNSLTGNISPTIDGWHHVVWVYDGAGLTVYIDKVKVPTSPVPIQGFLINNDVPMYVGFDCDEFDEFFFDGMMDDLKVWSRALSAVDVAGL